MVIIRDPFLGKTNGHLGKEDADDDADDVGDERYEEVSGLRVVNYTLCDVVVQLYTPPSPHYSEKYPRPQQHSENANQ